MRHDYTGVNLQEQYARVVETIAAEMHLPIDEVRRVYDNEFARLKVDARIFDHLALFAARRTRATLARPH